MTIDIEALRDYLRDYFGAAAFSGLTAAYGDLSIVESAGTEELDQIAIDNKVDLSKFEIKNGRGY